MDIYENMYDQEAEINKILASTFAEGKAEGRAEAQKEERNLFIEDIAKVLKDHGIDDIDIKDIIEALQEI